MDKARTTTTGPYVIEHGDVWVDMPHRHDHVCDGSGFMAIAYDAVEDCILKHGEEERVQAWADKTRRKLGQAAQAIDGDAPLFSIAVLSFPVHAETIDELNACIARGGRIDRLIENLTEIGGRLGPAVRYPK